MDLLLDMDNVLAEFDRGVMVKWAEQFPNQPLHSFEDRREFFIDDDHPSDLRIQIATIYRQPGFFRDLLPVPGSQAAVTAMLQLGWHISICTAPLLGVPTCLPEKHDWVFEHFGKNLADQMIIVRDKTLIRGDVLIDDRPAVTGLLTPVWEHVLYDQPYNRQAAGLRRLTWDNWQSVLSHT